MKRPNIRIIGVPEEEDKKGHETRLEEIIVEKFPKIGKEIATQVQETQFTHQNTDTSVPNQETLTSQSSNPTHW